MMKGGVFKSAVSIAAALFLTCASALGIIHVIGDDDSIPIPLSKTIWVDDDFADDPPNHKWNTIQEGLIDASNGDTVQVNVGNYYGKVVVDKEVRLLGENQSRTIIDGSGSHDFVEIRVDGVYLSGFTITNGSFGSEKAGVRITSSYNIVSGNTIDAASYYGIYVHELWKGSRANTIEGNVILNNVIGIRLGYVGSNVVANNRIQNNTEGIHIADSSGDIIRKNIFSNNTGDGICLWDATGVTVDGNIFWFDGIHVGVYSKGDTISNNYVFGTNWDFIVLYDSESMKVTSNVMLAGGIYLDGDAVEYWNTHSIDTSNLLNGKPVHYWKNVVGGKIPQGAGQILLANCENILVDNQEISDSYAAVQMGFSNGIEISGNTFSTNFYAIISVSSQDSLIYHNNIVQSGVKDEDPAHNYWHHPSLLEGNYWSSYPGLDNGAGLDKHAIAGDGIGDTFIPHPDRDFDFYPCIFPDCENPVGVGPIADAGPDQTVNEGGTVYFNGTGSQASGYGWHKLDVNFATDSALHLRKQDPLGPYRGGWEGGVTEWVTFTSTDPFWIGKKAGHLGQGPEGKEYTYYWKMHESGNFTLHFRAGNGGFDASVYDETDGVYIVSGLHAEQGSEDVLRYLDEEHVYRLHFYNTYVLSGFPNDLDVIFELNETEILLTPLMESLVYYKSLDPLSLDIDGSGARGVTFYSRGEQVFYAYYANQLNHSEVEVTGGELGLANPPYNTGITPGEYSDIPLGGGELSFSWDFDADIDTDGDGDTTNDIDATGPTPTHVYSDNGVYTVTLTVTDGSGLAGTDTCIITVMNVPPSVELDMLPMKADVSLRIAGEKWHDVSVELYENGTLIAEGSLTRYPGSPNDQMLYLAHIGVDMSITYSAIIEYTPWDDPVNGQPLGADPVWIILNFSDGEELRLQHNFNVNHPDRWVWEVDLTAALLSRGVGFKATVVDPGADDLTVRWDFGDGSNMTNFYPNPGDVFPVEIVDEVFHVFSSGAYTVTLTVIDDDGGEGMATANVSIP